MKTELHTLISKDMLILKIEDTQNFKTAMMQFPMAEWLILQKQSLFLKPKIDWIESKWYLVPSRALPPSLSHVLFPSPWRGCSRRELKQHGPGGCVRRGRSCTVC